MPSILAAVRRHRHRDGKGLNWPGASAIGATQVNGSAPGTGMHPSGGTIAVIGAGIAAPAPMNAGVGELHVAVERLGARIGDRHAEGAVGARQHEAGAVLMTTARAAVGAGDAVRRRLQAAQLRKPWLPAGTSDRCRSTRRRSG